MSEIPKLLEELSELQSARQNAEHSIKENLKRAQELTLQWQDLCSHPEEYNETQEDGSIKCCACGKIVQEAE